MKGGKRTVKSRIATVMTCVLAIGWSGGALAQSVPAPQASTDQYRATPDFSGSVNSLRMRGMIRPDLDTPDGFRSYGAMLVTGKCLAGIGRKGFTEAFSNGLNTPAERQQLQLLRQRLATCIPANSPTVLSLIRGSVSESLYRKDVGAKEAQPLAEPQIVAFEVAQRPRLATLDASDHGIAMVTDCLVARQPERARTILASEHGSRQESDAMDAMFAASPQCASAKRPSNVSRPFLRAFIANSAYRLERWQAQQPGASS